VESTRIDPRPLFATPTVAEAPLEVFGVAAVAAFPPPPHAAMARAAIGMTAALARKVIGLLRVMSLLRVGRIDSRSARPWSNQATRSPRPKSS
jgi:hypothetical protein